GDPLGTMVSGGELVSEPYTPRSVAAWSPSSGLRFDSPTFASYIEPVGAPRIRIDGINRSVRAGEVILFTQKGGMASSKLRCTAMLLEAKRSIPISGAFSLRLKTIVRDLTDIPVALDEAILMVSPQRVAEVNAALYAGLTYDFRIHLAGEIDWNTVTDAIGGGPRLVKNGSVSVPRDYERFDASYNNRHPRSAIGYTKNNEVVVVAVDGRSTNSKGLTLDELARLMVKLGCTDAMNLDGGGSTTMVLGGTVLNKPSDGGLRGVANALLLFSPSEPPIQIGIRATSLSLKPGDVTTLRLIDATGAVVPNGQAVWTSSGAAGWIGGDGAFRATEPGKATVRAFARGSWTAAEFSVSIPGTTSR
ncbi:MAG: phosphodiester glycosidase family protein, partial [Fimbriimonadales bacterium]